MNRLTVLSQALAQSTLHSRRTFLLRGGSALAFPLALASCGGGGDFDNGTPSNPGNGTGTPTTPIVTLTPSSVKGTIALPAGATVKIDSVGNAFGVETPAADGSFDFVSVAESEMFAVAIGPGGKMVLCGLLQSGSAQYSTQLSARSTAVCLAYTVLGVGVFLPSTQEQYLAAIQASPALAALESAVAAAIVARGEGWLDLTDPALKGALAGVQAALSPTALAGGTTMASRSSIQSVASSADADRVHAQGMIVDKTARTSGLQVTGDGVGSITITNYYRRRSYAYVERVSYKASYDGADIPSPAVVGIQPLKIDATKSITNTLVTLAQLYAGVKDFYDPVVTPPIPTPIAPADAALTSYRVTSVGLGEKLGDLALLTTDQRAGLRTVCAETLVLDVFVPIFTGILIPLKVAPITSFIETLGLSALKDVISALAASDDILLNKIVAADRPLSDVLWDTLITVVNSDNFKNAFILFFQEVIDSLALSGFKQVADSVVNNGAKALFDAISAVDLMAQTMDLVVTALTFGFANLADRFSIDVTKSVVRLNPQNPQVDPASLLPTNFTLSVIDSDLTSDDLSYQWSCTCLFGDISDLVNSSTRNGTSFPSSFPNLAYVPRGQPLGGDQDVLTGTVYKGHQITPGPNSRVPIGSMTSTLTYSVPMTPASTVLKFDGQQAFSAGISTSLLQSGKSLKYIWTVTGGSGSLSGASTQTTADPQITYTAGHARAGTDTLALQVVDLLGVVLASGSATVKVLSNIRIGIGPPNPTLAKGAKQVFTAYTDGGALPDGVNYRWQLSGGGSIGPSLVAITTDPSITYTASATGNGPDSLSVTLRDADNNPLATGTTTISIQSDWVGVYRGTLTGPGCQVSSDLVQIQIILAGDPNVLRISVSSLYPDGYPSVGEDYYAPFTAGDTSINGHDVQNYYTIAATLQGGGITFTDTAVACHGATVTRVFF